MAGETINEYNGWANYPTWVVNLWLDNDPGWDWSGIRSGDQLKAIIEESADELIGSAGMLADILGWALCFVRWDEIVRNHLLDDVADDVGDWNPVGVLLALHSDAREIDQYDPRFFGNLLRVSNARLDSVGLLRDDVNSLLSVRVRGKVRLYVTENGDDYARVI